MTSTRKEMAIKKRVMATSMLKRGKKNTEIETAVKKSYGTGIGSDTLSSLRKSLGVSGNKHHKTKPKTSNPKTVKPKTMNFLEAKVSPRMNSAIGKLVEAMRKENIMEIHALNDGTVDVKQLQVFTVRAE